MAKSTSRDVQLYLSHAGGSESDILKPMNVGKLEKFIVVMKDPDPLKFKPSTCREKFYGIKLVLKFIRTFDDEGLFHKADKAITCIEDWISGLGKDVLMQRKEYCLLVREKLPYLQDPDEFLNDPEV